MEVITALAGIPDTEIVRMIPNSSSSGMVTPSVPEVKLAVEIADAELVMDNCCELPLQIVAEGGLTVASNGFTVSVAALVKSLAEQLPVKLMRY